MPELPEVYTTVQGIKLYAKGRTIVTVWTDFDSPHYYGKENIKDPAYFKKFVRVVRGQKIIGATQRGKYILIELGNYAHIVVHMKMTGHLMYGTYYKTGNRWEPKDKTSDLADPFNRHVHLVFTLDNGKHLVLCDSRKFATVYVTNSIPGNNKHLAAIGKHPLETLQTGKDLAQALSKLKNQPIKKALLDQSGVAGVGNIYSDEALFYTGIHPLRKVHTLSTTEWSRLLKGLKKVLTAAIKTGGDSDSDYRNILGKRGNFQNFHQVYRKTNAPCPKPGCHGTIQRIVINGRSAHFCNIHQI